MSGRLPLDDFERALRSRIERMIRDIMGDIPGLIESIRWVDKGGFLVPESDIHVKGDMILVVIQIPGAQKESINIRIRDSVLEVEAGFSEELAKKASGASLFRFQGYRCSINLPRDVDPKLSRATYREGILILELPIQKPKGIQVKIE